MSRFFVLSIIFFVFLSACSVMPNTLSTETPTATITSTATPTPVPTSTITPTLEPWMQALPENIVSVEIKEGAIWGIDAQSNLIMEFDLEKNQWVKIISDIPTYITERTRFYEDQYGMSWSELVDKFVYKNEQYRERHNSSGKFNEFPHFSFDNDGYVLGVSTLPVKNESWQKLGITEEVVLEMALPGSEELGLMLCGVVQDGKYKSFCGPIETQGENPDEAELKVLYEGLFFGGTFVNYFIGSPERMKNGWAELENGVFDEGSQENWIQGVSVLRMGDNWELWKELVLDPDGPISNNYRFFVNLDSAARNGEISKPEVADVKTMGAYHLWAYRESGYANPVLIPMWFGRLYVYD